MANLICAVDACDSASYLRGWCIRHYGRWLRHGDPLAGRRSHLDPLPQCAIVGCTMATKRIILGLCENHYWRSRHRSDDGGPDLLLIKGRPQRRFWEKVNRDAPTGDFRPELGPCWLWTGRPEGKGYGQIRVNNRAVMVHRFSYELLVGPIPDDLTIDHLCMVKLCVRPSHLEPVTSEENTRRALAARAIT